MKNIKKNKKRTSIRNNIYRQLEDNIKETKKTGIFSKFYSNKRLQVNKKRIQKNQESFSTSINLVDFSKKLPF